MPYSSFLQRAICLLMAIQVTVVGTGFCVHEHLCLVKRTKTVSLFHKVTCQPETVKVECTETDAEARLKRSKCCLNKVTHYKIQTPSVNFRAFQKVSLPADWIYCLLPSYFHSSTCEHRLFTFRFFQVTANAPPLYGRSMLIFIQSFLI